MGVEEELHELQEHAEHGKHNPDAAPVSLTMAVLAVVVATVSLLGHRAHTEEVIIQGKVNDGWAYYQAKNIRRNSDQIAADLATVIASKDGEQVSKIKEKYEAEADRYKDELKDLETEARKLENERDLVSHRANRFDLGEVFLEIALVVTSITLLSGKRWFWFLGIIFGICGSAVAVSSLLVH